MKHAVVDAVTAVFTCADQGFITVRSPEMPAFPGYHAFPGGKVDATDPETPIDLPWLRDHEPKLMHALCRELDEEVGFDLQAGIESGLVKGIWKLGVAVTPKFEPRRFDTRFYRIDLAEPVAFDVDPRETVHGEWAPWRELAERYHDGHILAVPPTVVVIEQFADNPDETDLSRLHFDFDAERFLPCVEAIKGVRLIPVPSHTLPPAMATNCFIIGDDGAQKFMVDPSPKDETVLQRLCNTADRIGFDAIFLTHHHPDHRQYADKLARRYQCPIHLSQDSFERIEQKTAGRFFDGIETVIRKEGEVLTQWLGRDVQILEVPGHDEGQLALMSEDRAWCIVSDLFQGVGTVVIAKPEGNMAKYFKTLQRVIDLDPKVIYPSHGMGMGTTYRLRVTLAHRKMREQEILTLHQQGKSNQEMLDVVYAGLDPRLAPLALCNIENHLDKLRDENRI
ncbi:MAG: MBL fold metallo-hydrolase [Salinisphaeraceae bacterium]|nr:MBL fold metallo-hydrolase [Salinisphaeraceae bacterium]